MPENIFPGTNLLPTPPRISMVLKQNKKEVVCSFFGDVSLQKQLQQPPWLMDFAKILPSCV